MKGVQLYHSIRYLRSIGHSIRSISKHTKVSTCTIQKYLKLDNDLSLKQLLKVDRKSDFDQAQDFIDKKLSLFPEISSSKLFRLVKEAYPDITSKPRSFRSYIAKIRPNYGKTSHRYYQPIQTDKPGFQVQVDPGEDWVLLDNNQKMKVYFVAFIFGFSRQRYFYIQDRPFNTSDFIRAHKEAFSFFGGIAQEYVYDQTKLVVISERYREVWLNEEFSKFALKLNFLPVICEGYDPESKGKVERLVSYIKSDFLYGETFSGLNDIRNKSIIWLKQANSKVHSTTNCIPSVIFNEERNFLQEYKAENLIEKRLVDKMGLISYKSNKYSVPYNYQRKVVLIKVIEPNLIIMDIKTNEEVCNHNISASKGIQVINTNHYRSYEEGFSEAKTKCLKELAHIPNSELLIDKIVADNPKIKRDQLRGLLITYRNNQTENWNTIIALSLQLENIRVSTIVSFIKEAKRKKELAEIKDKITLKGEITSSSKLDRSLSKYDEVCK